MHERKAESYLKDDTSSQKKEVNESSPNKYARRARNNTGHR